jgi:hypothetical protein
MAIVTSISGYSGSGKSRSMKHMDWKTTFVIRPNRKPFPFKSNMIKEWDSATKTGNFIYTHDYGFINAVIQKLPEYGFTKIIIEDSTHLLLQETMETASEKGYDKYVLSALHYYNLLKTAESLPDNIRAYLVNHLDENQNGDEIIKVTGGKLITEKIDVPSLLTIALKAEKIKDKYYFRTQSNGRSFHKSPEDMFTSELIDNDLNQLDSKICDYYVIYFEEPTK